MTRNASDTSKLRYVQIEPRFLTVQAADLSAAEAGIYLRLILHLYSCGGSIPHDVDRIRRIVGNPRFFSRYWPKVLTKFTHDEHTISDATVTEQVTVAERKRCSRNRASVASEVGKADFDAKATDNTSVSKEKRSKVKKKEDQKDISSVGDGQGGSFEESLFERFWDAYPVKVGKAPARAAFAKIEPAATAEFVDHLVGRITEQSAWPQWTQSNGRFIPHAATWLNQRRWEDEMNAEESANAKVVSNEIEDQDWGDNVFIPSRKAVLVRDGDRGGVS